MILELSPEQEQLIDQAIQAGLIHAANDVLDAGVETIRRRLAEQQTSHKTMAARQWSQEFHVWVRSHSTATPLLSDDAISRDSLYGTLGI